MNMKDAVKTFANNYAIDMAKQGCPLDIYQVNRLENTMTLLWLEAENHVLKQQVADLDKKVESGV